VGRVVSLRPAVSTTDQCVVTNAGERGTGSPPGVGVEDAAGPEVLTFSEDRRIQNECKNRMTAFAVLG
jgi:hypothetical protein